MTEQTEIPGPYIIHNGQGQQVTEDDLTNGTITCGCSQWYGLSVTQQVPYTVKHACFEHENHFWQDPMFHPTRNDAEALVFFIDKTINGHKDALDFQIRAYGNANDWIPLDNQGFIDLLQSVERLQVYDLATGQMAILGNPGAGPMPGTEGMV